MLQIKGHETDDQSDQNNCPVGAGLSEVQILKRAIANSAHHQKSKDQHHCYSYDRPEIPRDSFRKKVDRGGYKTC